MVMMSIWIILYILSAPLLVLESYCADDVLKNDGTSISDKTQQESSASIAVKTPRGEGKHVLPMLAHSDAIGEDEHIKQAGGSDIDDAWNNTYIRPDLPGMLDEFCPGANVCQEDESWVWLYNVNSSTCCGACSCSDNCQASRNCCFPSPDRNKYENKHSRCYSTIHPEGYNSESFGYKSYIMVDSEMDSNSTFINTCGNTQVAPWGSLYPVYSKSHDAIYKNSVCAAMYGVDDAVLWQAYVACIHTDVLTKITLTSATLLEERCDVWFKFPGDVSVLEKFICFLNLVSTCPEKFRATSLLPHEQITAACDSGLLSPYRGKDRAIYRNVFCAVCNDRYHDSMCLSEDVIARRPRAYTALLDNAVFENVNDHTIAPQARLFSEGIVIESTCRPVMCPSDQIYTADGRCKSIYKTLYKPKVAVALQLTSDVQINTTGLTKLAFMSPWLRHWQFSKIFYLTPQASQLDIVDKIIVVIRRSFDNIKSKVLGNIVNKLKNNKWTVKTANSSHSLTADFMNAIDSYSLNTQQIDFRTRLVKKEINVTRQLSVIYQDRVSTKVGFLTIDHMTFCDQVELSTDDFKIHNHVLYNNFNGEYLLPDEYYFPELADDTSVRVCIERSGLRRVSNGCNDVIPVLTTYISLYYVLILFNI